MRDQLFQAIGWTLLHSLWQGLLAAVLAGIIIMSTRKTSARIRYNLLSGVFILFVITTLLTFLQLSSSIKGTGGSFSELAVTSTGTSQPVSVAVSPATIFDQFSAYFNTHADIFVLAWAIFFSLHCIKLMTAFGEIRRIRTHKVHEVSGEWMEKFAHLKELIGIKQAVSLLQSGLIKVPVAIGFFKPVILLPFGLLTSLPPDQVETILLHELAHIRRRDYLVNIVQRLTEAIYFFNPALLWISSLLRQEREACCDDMVIAATDKSETYLQALISFQELTIYPRNAMAVSTKKNYLLNRVRRMLRQQNNNLNNMEKLLLTLGVVAVTAFAFTPAQHEVEIKRVGKDVKLAVPGVTSAAAKTAPIDSNKPVIKKAKTPMRDTVPVVIKQKTSYDALVFPGISTSINDDGTTRTESVIVTDQDGKKYAYKKLNEKVISLTIDGKAIVENEFDNYTELIKKIQLAIRESKKMKFTPALNGRALIQKASPLTLTYAGYTPDLSTAGKLDYKPKNKVVL